MDSVISLPSVTNELQSSRRTKKKKPQNISFEYMQQGFDSNVVNPGHMGLALILDWIRRTQCFAGRH